MHQVHTKLDADKKQELAQDLSISASDSPGSTSPPRPLR